MDMMSCEVIAFLGLPWWSIDQPPSRSCAPTGLLLWSDQDPGLLPGSGTTSARSAEQL